MNGQTEWQCHFLSCSSQLKITFIAAKGLILPPPFANFSPIHKVTLCEWLNQGSHKKTRPLSDSVAATMHKLKHQICKLAKASSKENWSIQLVRPSGLSSWSVQLVSPSGPSNWYVQLVCIKSCNVAMLQNCYKLPKVAKSCQKLPEVSRSFHKLPKVAKSCQNTTWLQTYGRTYGRTDRWASWAAVAAKKW